MHVWLAHIAWSASLGLTCIGWQSTGEGKDEKETLHGVLNVNWQVPHLAKMETTYTCSVSECENYIRWNTWNEIDDTSIIVDERFNYLIEELSKLASRFFSFQTQEQIFTPAKTVSASGRSMHGTIWPTKLRWATRYCMQDAEVSCSRSFQFLLADKLKMLIIKRSQLSSIPFVNHQNSHPHITYSQWSFLLFTPFFRAHLLCLQSQLRPVWTRLPTLWFSLPMLWSMLLPLTWLLSSRERSSLRLMISHVWLVSQPTSLLKRHNWRLENIHNPSDRTLGLCMAITPPIYHHIFAFIDHRLHS